MKLKIYSHLAVLLELSAFLFITIYLVLLFFSSLNNTLLLYFLSLFVSLLLAEIIIHLFLEIRVVHRK
ncbi:hypothetical protein FMV2238Y02_14200 [Streptococcus canis]|uniref:Uncharacterized protein n=1 Tax=Streptococcus canis TaxID=1329 RepID=A0A3P5XR20_STRCB|nr:hypothetical protein FMV2238Y02_14200 [Streptococcus canis]